MSRKTPEWRLDAELLLELMRPEDFAVGRIQAGEIPLGAEAIDSALANHRRHARPGRITDGARAFVLVLPQEPAVSFVQAKNTFEATDHLLVEGVCGVASTLGKKAISDIDTPLGNAWTSVAAGDGRAPQDGWAVAGELLDDPGFTPDRITVGAEPLRPVLGYQQVSGGNPAAQ